DICDKCGGTGAESGSRSINCPVCGGRGQVMSSRGFFQVSQTCPRCRGVGHIVEKACRACEGEGRLEKPSRIKLKIPAGIADGSRLRSPRNGEAGIRGGPQGDLYVVVHPQLNDGQGANLQEFAELCGEENTPLRKSFFERAKEFFH